MAHESFEDETVAALLNEAFVCIKVDREERPDIDGIYMSVCQMMTGSGGWPLTIVMTPDRRPFFAATYIPKESRWGRMGLRRADPAGSGALGDRGATRSRRPRRRRSRPPEATPGPSEGDLPVEETPLPRRRGARAGSTITPTADSATPRNSRCPISSLFLLRHWRRTGEEDALRMADGTLAAMRRGGICDQLGFGFHRYSTDRQWLVPHFEKMLYDQALLALAFAEAFQATGDEAHARTAREILDYCLRDLRAPEGGFFTAEDADSEGEEGRFYLWSMEEIRRLLAPEEVPLAAAAYRRSPRRGTSSIRSSPNGGGGISSTCPPPRRRSPEGLGMTEKAFRKRLEAVRLRLLAARGKAGPPQRDDKILTDWNGLMIAALARAARVLDEPRYLEAARSGGRVHPDAPEDGRRQAPPPLLQGARRR